MGLTKEEGLLAAVEVHYLILRDKHTFERARIEAAKVLGLDIKSCPFCGTFPYLSNGTGNGNQLVCANDACNGNEEGYTVEDALYNWNKRS